MILNPEIAEIKGGHAHGGTENALEKPFDQYRALDKGICRPQQAEDFQLILPGHQGQADGV